MKHVMIDLETLGSTPGCAILSIGAVRFDLATMKHTDEFYVNIDLKSCLERGLKVEADTFYWWMQQSDAARMLLAANKVSLCDALSALESFIEPNECVWGHGPSFDLAVLHCAFTACNKDVPWKFRNERDTRTILSLADMVMPKSEGSHHALNDAKSQADTVMVALNRLKHCGVHT